MNLQHPITGEDDIFVVGLALPQKPGLALKCKLQSLGYQVILMSKASDVAHLITNGHFDALVYDPDLEGACDLLETASARMFPFLCISASEKIYGEICSDVREAHGRFVFPRMAVHG